MTWHPDGVRVAIHVRPGVRAIGVGGCRGDALVVRVRERAVDGKAPEAALVALAAALELPRRDITLVAGASSRIKLVDIPDSAGPRMVALRAREPSS